MVRQKLFVGSNYANGLFGKKILVVGHQKHATAEEREKSKNDSTYQYTSTDDNVEMQKEVRNYFHRQKSLDTLQPLRPSKPIKSLPKSVVKASMSANNTALRGFIVFYLIII